jgi:cytosine/uracil/thiamine/allantoin permease
MSVCIPTYMFASGLIVGGMSWRQAIGTILLGNLIVLVPMLLNGHAGAAYGIPYPTYLTRVAVHSPDLFPPTSVPLMESPSAMPV